MDSWKKTTASVSERSSFREESAEDKEEHTFGLKRIKQYEREFRLLEFVFAGSRAFFSHEGEVLV